MHENYEIIKPVGLRKPIRLIEEICFNAVRYRRAERHPGPFLIFMNAGSGRRTLCKYILEKFERDSVIPFTGIDHLITLDFKDSLKPFEIHDSAAIYDQWFKGIEVHTLTDGFANYLYENNLHIIYLKKTAEVNQYATLVVFIPERPGKSLERLVGNLKTMIDPLNIEVAPYTNRELAMITERTVLDSGTVISADDFIRHVSVLIRKRGITRADDAAALGHEMIFRADFGNGIPYIDNTLLEKLCDPDLYSGVVKNADHDETEVVKIYTGGEQ